jgi:hypothetical protein
MRLVSKDMVFECSDERGEAILMIQRKMKINVWDVDRSTDKGTDRHSPASKRDRTGKGSSKQA